MSITNFPPPESADFHHTSASWAFEQVFRKQNETIAAMQAQIKSLMEGREDLLERISILEQRLSAMRDWGE